MCARILRVSIRAGPGGGVDVSIQACLCVWACRWSHDDHAVPNKRDHQVEEPIDTEIMTQEDGSDR